MSTIDAGQVLTSSVTAALRAPSSGIFAGGSTGNHGLPRVVAKVGDGARLVVEVGGEMLSAVTLLERCEAIIS